MQMKANTDTLGGSVVLIISAFFYLQLGDDFSSFGIYFPERVLPLLVILGAILLVRGLVRRKEPKKVIFQINRTMLLSMVIGAAWALLLEFCGFISISFVSLSLLVTAYSPKEKLTAKNILINCIGVFVVVILFYYVFSRLLGVTLPSGKMFSVFR